VRAVDPFASAPTVRSNQTKEIHMKWPAFGPWADATMTDTKLLLDIANASPDAAVGVLANPNLTDEDARYVASRATLSHANTRASQIGKLSPAVQKLVVEIALQRWKASARDFTEFIDPAVAYDLYTDCVRGGFNGATYLAEAIRNSALYERYAAHPDKASHLRLLKMLVDAERDNVAELIVADDEYAGSGYIANVIPLMAGASTNVHQLASLTEYFDAFHPGARGVVSQFDALLNWTWDHPEVVMGWAKAHPVGAVIAAGDPRLSFETLQSLKSYPVPEQWNALLESRLAGNPQSNAEDPADTVVAAFNAMMHNPSVSALKAWAKYVEPRIAALEAGATAPVIFENMDTDQLAAFVRRSSNLRGAFVNIAVLLHPSNDDPALQETLLDASKFRLGMAPETLRAAIAAKLKETGAPLDENRWCWERDEFLKNWDGTPTRSELRAARNARQRLIEEAKASELLDMRYDGTDVVAVYPQLFDTLTTVSQWSAVIHDCDEDPTDPARDILARVLPAVAPQEPTSFAGLYGDPLGELV
jgi:hypothetical protein